MNLLDWLTSTDEMPMWLRLLQAAAALTAFFSAFYAMKAARSADKAAIESRLAATSVQMSQLISEYQGDEMRRALQLLAWVNGQGLGSVPEGDSNVDNARRQVHWYFKKIWMLYDSGGLVEDQVRSLVTNVHGYVLWKEVALPLSKMWDPDDKALDWHRWADTFIKKFG